MGEAGDACGEGAAHIGINQRHFRRFIVVLIMHVLNQIQDVDIEASEPVQHLIVFMHHFVVVEDIGSDRRIFGSYLHVVAVLVEELLVFATVDGIEQGLGKVGAGAEELHLFAGFRGADAAADAVVVAPDRAHYVVVFILDGRCADRDAGRIVAERLRQTGAVKDGEVRLRCRSHVFQRVQETEIVLCDHGAAIHA